MPELVSPPEAVVAPPDLSRYLETYILDPLAEDVSNSPLELTGRDPGHSIYLGSIKFPAPEETNTRASGRDVEGDLPVGEPTHRNRTIPIEVVVTEERGYGEAENLLSNPGFGNGATRWNAVSSAVISQSSVRRHGGEYSLKIEPPGAVVGEGVQSDTSQVTGGQTVYAAAWAWIPTNLDVAAWLIEYDGVGFSLTEVDRTVGDVVTGQGGWVLLRVARTFGTPASGHQRHARLLVATDEASGNTFFVGLSSLCDGVDPIFPFGGDTPGCTWSGTAQDSPSERPGTGDDRVRFEAALHQLEAKLMKLSAEQQGTLKRWLPDGSWEVFDLVGAKLTGDNWDRPFSQGRSVVQFELEAKPYARLTPIQTEEVDSVAGSPAVISMIVPGDVSALGRLVVREQSGVDRRLFMCGGRSRTYDPAAPLIYQAEDLTLGPGVTIGHVTDDSGSSVGITTTSGTFFTQVCQINAAPHVGTYRVIARVRNNGFVLPLWALEWGQGEELAVTSPPRFVSNGDVWCPVDLGLVDLNPASLGTNKWWGWIGFSAPAAVEVRVDLVALIPAEFGYTEISVGDSDLPVIHQDEALEVRWDGVQREAPAGAFWGPLTRGYVGDRLRIPPSGKEGHLVEMAAFAGFAGFGRPDGAPWFNQISLQLVATPRVIDVPDPT
jgi:hypothetical protein